VVACSASPETAYWRRHPDVTDVVSVPRTGDDGGPGYEVHFWLRPTPEDAPEPPRPRTRRPGRVPDLELFASGELHPTFASQLPDAEHIEVFAELGWDEACPAGWWAVRIWLPDGASGAQDR
jgi:hypothetical protein